MPHYWDFWAFWQGVKRLWTWPEKRPPRPRPPTLEERVDEIERMLANPHEMRARIGAASIKPDCL